LQALEANLGEDDLPARPAVRPAHMQAAIDPVTATRQEFEAASGGCLVVGLGQDPPTASDDSVGGDDKIILDTVHIRHRLGLGPGEASSVVLGQLTRLRRLVELGGENTIRLKAHLTQEVETTRRGRRQNQEGCGGRHRARLLVYLNR